MEAGSIITITLPDGSELTTEVDPDGIWSIDTITELKPGEQIKVVQEDTSGNKTMIMVVVIESTEELSDSDYPISFSPNTGINNR